MDGYWVSHLSDETITSELSAFISRERVCFAAALARIAEFDERKLYRIAAYDSMYAYCVRELHLSENAAFKRIRAARKAREFPELFIALADGRLQLHSVLALGRFLTPENVAELIAAAAYKTRAQLEVLVAGLAPRADVSTLVVPVTDPEPVAAQERELELQKGVSPLHEPQHAEAISVASAAAETRGQRASDPVRTSERVQASAPVTRGRVTPLAPQRFALQVTISQDTLRKLQRAQELLSHALPAGDVSSVLDRALDALVERLEKRKYATVRQPRTVHETAPAPGKRYIPAAVRRAVNERDDGQCTYVGPSGRRCESTRFLEFDHIQEIARGGASTTDSLRLRCREHNQLAAECTYGSEYMAARRARRRERVAASWPADSSVTTEQPANRPRGQLAG